MLDRSSLSELMLDTFKKIEVFNEIQLKWLESVLNRMDGKDGIEQLTLLAQKCKNFLDEKEKLNPWECYLHIKFIKQLFENNLQYSSIARSVFVGVPQRKQHKNFIAPNLKNLVGSQACKMSVDGAFGLGYCESRNTLVQRAVYNNFSHILLIDDDMLVPADIVQRLLSYNEPIIGANYTKKVFTLESIATATLPDDKYIYSVKSVEPVENDLTPMNISGMGLGCVLIETDIFKKIEPPWFKFEYDAEGKITMGEDMFFFRKTKEYGFNPKIIPGLCCAHVDFKTGKIYGPEWLVDLSNNVIKKPYKEKYTEFVCNPKELSF